MATPHPAPLATASPVSLVRPARRNDAEQLAALSRPFALSGALRERPTDLYATHAAEFLVVESLAGELDGCVGLKTYGEAGVLYNFCVAEHRQGTGVGGRLMEAALERAQLLTLTALFTATAGSGALFLRHGFTPARTDARTPPGWHPRQGSRVLVHHVR
ncbi:GNAT family N-acetyltransferase [Streptomyces acidiscabies]|uniref:GNAT family N-acetyltransferase n=1 Tax=Streptomyces acidiscabies TaxID=42234 RepID=A0ABU4M5B9_9ACTN|nr:GNAT family N-acetyltransferase [Streptomyces acidiscabies]MDX3023240.1 GNAT family N-acetyltransferase [Streptomyces acidiscabies]GAQ51029.1 N-acetylglutamate synthase [Streptomyces acidiscabies]GAV46298.1 N-acetylglutamate synthase [Streptomyces acidiscabies]